MLMKLTGSIAVGTIAFALGINASAGGSSSGIPTDSGTNGKFSWFSVTGSESTIAYGIDADGKIVGTYDKGTSPTCGGEALEHGFVTKDYGKRLSTIEFKGRDVTATEVTAINGEGLIAGIYETKCGPAEEGTGGAGEDHGFVLSDGDFETLPIPKQVYVGAKKYALTAPDIRGINDEEVVSGGFTISSGGVTITGSNTVTTTPCGRSFCDYGFVLTEDKFRVLEACDGLSTATGGCLPGTTDGWGLNNANAVVGHYEDMQADTAEGSAENFHHGFIWTKQKGFMALLCEGVSASNTDANGINDAGIIVGRCDSKAFVLFPPYRDQDWTVFSIPEPSCPIGMELNKTVAWGISNEGKNSRIVGSYTCENSAEQTFAFVVKVRDVAPD